MLTTVRAASRAFSRRIFYRRYIVSAAAVFSVAVLAGVGGPTRLAEAAAWQGPPCRLWQGPPEDLWQGPVQMRGPPAPPELALGPAAAVVWGLGGLAAVLARRGGIEL